MPSSDNFIGGISFATTSFLSTIPLLNATTELLVLPLRILKKVWKKFFHSFFIDSLCIASNATCHHTAADANFTIFFKASSRIRMKKKKTSYCDYSDIFVTVIRNIADSLWLSSLFCQDS